MKPPCVLPKILERVAPARGGTITGLYTVLVEGDDLTDPIADFVRAILDGHIVLTRDLASMGHYPAIDVLQSVSRVMPNIVEPNHLSATRSILELMATYRNAEDLINLGAYRSGANPRLDLAVSMNDSINRFLRQGVSERASLAESLQALEGLVSQAKEIEQSQARTGR